jgi:hypothetical protein
MDCRVKPGNDDREAKARGLTVPPTLLASKKKAPPKRGK